MNFQMFKLDLEKAEEPEIKLPTSVGSSKKEESARRNINLRSADNITHMAKREEELSSLLMRMTEQSG